MAVNGKIKGNSFERKIANRLSERFEEITGLKKAFRRNTDSGSFFGRSNQVRIETHGTEHADFGDLLAPTNFEFSVECKFYKEPPSFSAMAKQEWKTFDNWIGQAEQDAENSGKKVVIIIKFNNVPELAMVREHNEDAVMRYKGYDLVPLEKWLEHEDGYFFA